MEVKIKMSDFLKSLKVGDEVAVLWNYKIYKIEKVTKITPKGFIDLTDGIRYDKYGNYSKRYDAWRSENAEIKELTTEIKDNLRRSLSVNYIQKNIEKIIENLTTEQLEKIILWDCRFQIKTINE
jgi:protoheme ferro-lyase